MEGFIFMTTLSSMYTVDPNVDEPIILINKHIGFDEKDGYGIMGDLFQEELLRLDALGKKRIQVWINSPGGTVVDGYAIYNAILKSTTKVDTYCIGIAASIAGVIFQAGRTRHIADYGILMYHNPFGGENSAGLEAMRNSIVKMIESRCGMDEQAVAKMMERETFITAAEAIQMKLADKIEVSTDFNKKRMLPVVNDSRGYWKESNLIINKLLNKNTMSLLKVTNKLGLNDAANEDSILAGINAIENRAVKAEGELVTARADIDALNRSKKEVEDEMKKHKDAYEKCKKELDEMKNQAEEADNKLKEEKAKNMVNLYSKAGRIKADTVNAWVEKAKVDFEGTKALLDSISLNKDAIKIDEGIETKDHTESGLKNTAAKAMAEIRNRMKV